MSASRVAYLSLLDQVPTASLPHGGGPLDLPLENIVKLLPEGGDELLRLRDGGWKLFSATVEDSGEWAPEPSPQLDVYIEFKKPFEPARAADVAADARACGLTEWGSPDFCWDDPRDDDDDWRWNLDGKSVF